MGGLSHFHIDGRGHVNPCVFLPVSFGTIATESFPAIFRRMRLAIPFPLKAECPSLQLAPGIRALAGGPEATPVRYEDISADWNAMIHRAG
jgi:MoaA/NifB/PqqE/SkfB family radical SAM enzyme